MTILSGKEVSKKLSKELLDKVGNLKEGQVMAVQMRNVNSSDKDNLKVSIEFAEKLPSTRAGNESALNILNADDSRFASKARRAFVTASKRVAEKLFETKIPDNEGFVELGIIMQPVDGKEFRVRVVETTESQLTENQKKNINSILKFNPSTQAHFYDKATGERVASYTDVVLVNEGEKTQHQLWADGEWVAPEGSFTGVKETTEAGMTV